MNSSLLDASAILALLNDEPGAAAVEGAMRQSEPPAIGSVNLAEVVAKLNDAGVPEETARQAIGALRMDVLDFVALDAFAAGFLRQSTKSLGLSLGARACLAMAKRLQLPVLTADRRWATLNLGLQIELVR